MQCLALGQVVHTMPGMTDLSASLSMRIDTGIADLLRKIAEEHRMSVAMLIEKLVVDEAEALDLLPKGDPRRALVTLVNEVRNLIDGKPYLAKDPDVTLSVFTIIKQSPRLMKVYEAAISPPTGMRADKRRQFVHQRIGRFIKDYLGLVSVEEVTLPRGSDALIRGYTRLSK
jgi:hypothetical protein